MKHKEGNKVAFLFPGQGSYSYPVLRELYVAGGSSREVFEAASDTCARFFGLEFLPLVQATSADEHDYLGAFPDLDQVGIYLADVLIAQELIRRGFTPSVVSGHSFGELAALTVAGVFDVETGVKIVCQRVSTLASVPVNGKMAALSIGADEARSLIEPYPSLQISVINHARQTVVSGFYGELESLRNAAALQGIAVTILKSRYPFHSTHLASAVKSFETCLKGYDFRPAKIPVYLGTENRWLTPECGIAEVLSRQFTTRLDFRDTVSALFRHGCREFIECGGAKIVSKVVAKNLAADDGVVIDSVIDPESDKGLGVENGMQRIFGVAGQPPSYSTGSQFADDSRVIDEARTALRNVTREATKAEALLERLENKTPTHDVPAQLKARIAAVDDSDASERERFEYPPEACTNAPVAIVSLGCVLPGADNANTFWSNLVDGVCGIIDLADHRPHARQDFMAGSEHEIVSDKTYTLLNGSILETKYDRRALGEVINEDEFARLSRGQRILALAIGQTLADLPDSVTENRETKIEFILGATADGSEEYDEAFFADRVRARLGALALSERQRIAFESALERAIGVSPGAASALEQHRMYNDVTKLFFNRKVKTYVVDTACSSSLYSIDLGIKSLRDGESDLVFAGGVFAPGPANNTLFAQFRGLTPNASRPLDGAADGVVFADGAGIVAIKRLRDALDAGDQILGVIRGVGLSSDGKSPSVNVPQSEGQKLAVERAYELSGVDIATIQYVEAHATSTPVGDAAEFAGLNEVFSKRVGARAIEMGSVKALVGHTGWASGVASVIKFCKAFEHQTTPMQHFFETANKDIDLDISPFSISVENHPWPENVDRLPRRAGINGFGFGGTNAHLILEEYVPDYHRALSKGYQQQPRTVQKLAVVGVGSLFPGADKLESHRPEAKRRFGRDAFRLPARKMLLPDVTDHMDPSQYLAALAAEQILGNLPESWLEFKDEIGVVLGITSKTERGVEADERIFLDQFRRRVGEVNVIGNSDINAITEQVCENIKGDIIPSGPYTLPGLMPNVAAGRITSLFDLKGPNIVIDRGIGSLIQAIWTAEKLLANGNAKLMLAGALNGFAGVENEFAEGAVLLGLMTEECARDAGFPILAELEVRPAGEEELTDDGAHTLSAPGDGLFRAAHLGPQMLEALDKLTENGLEKVVIKGSNTATPNSEIDYSIVLSSIHKKTAKQPPQESDTTPKKDADQQIGAYAFVEGTPIYTATPKAYPVEAEHPAKSLEGKRILFLTDQPEFWNRVKEAGELDPLDFAVVAPAGTGVMQAVQVDPSTDATLEASLKGLGDGKWDAIIAVKDLGDVPASALLENDVGRECVFIDLLFGVTRHFYEQIAAGDVSLSSICFGSWDRDGNQNPYTGLVAGFMKSVARELPGANCSIINTDRANVLQGLRLIEVELGQGLGSREVSYREGERLLYKLVEIEKLAQDKIPCLNSDSVVIATGGGRGVTAVLAESLLERFGCRVIALGRTRIDGTPDNILNMTEEHYKAYEGQFYRDELARDKSQKIGDLRKKYWSYQAANELNQVVKRLQSLPGQFEYVPIDINDSGAVDRLVAGLFEKFGRVDLILHGAGIQVSKVIPKKPVELFRRIVATKLTSLSSLYKACKRRARADQPVHYHILTSAFSYMGNDGQPDYGAANEAMNRIAAAMATIEPRSYWSSMAWLGWAGIGMTRGTEFAALAANRRLRGVTKEEGQEIFCSLFQGRPAVAVNILIADGEINFYGTPVDKARSSAPAHSLQLSGNGVSSAAAPAKSLVEELAFSVENSPFLRDHLVRDVPTLPGAFIIGMVADVARKLRPNLKITAFENTRFIKFVSVFESKGISVRVAAEVISETGSDTVIQVRVLSDFVHKSGVILEKDILHTEIFVRMAPTIPKAPGHSVSVNGSAALELPDPYVMGQSPVRLNGQFNSMRTLQVSREYRTAKYKLADHQYPESPYGFLLPNAILVDAFWRFGTVAVTGEHKLSVFVPRECNTMKVFFDYADFGQPMLNGEFLFRGTNPRPDGELLKVGPIEVHDADENVMLVVEGGVCQRFGDIENAF